MPVTAAAQAIVDAPDRTEADRALDAGRHPDELLSLLALAPGMKVAELTAGGGYTTELLARAVGPGGRVWGQNSTFVLERFAEKPWGERLARPVMQQVVRADRELDDPLPADATGLDLVLSNLVHHDFYWQGVDRAKMHAAILKALRPGGRYVLIDHSARAGAGATEVESLHRLEERTAQEEVVAAGFVLAGTSDFLRNPEDTLDWSTSPRTAGERRGTSDRFVLVFEKPAAAAGH
ncbi:MAG: class I SAM-dependent methyltransferase [Kofleriaceae bacterium]|nr:class I SAM-dependent methyltransferase [Kofleriaceae bacterium]MCL4224266.1 SAM-dependent methyltransferase [Myxococcales bacterium]